MLKYEDNFILYCTFRIQCIVLGFLAKTSWALCSRSSFLFGPHSHYIYRLNQWICVHGQIGCASTIEEDCIFLATHVMPTLSSETEWEEHCELAETIVQALHIVSSSVCCVAQCIESASRKPVHLTRWISCLRLLGRKCLLPRTRLLGRRRVLRRSADVSFRDLQMQSMSHKDSV